MSILIVFLYALVVVLSLLLIGIVLIQPAKSGGMGAAFGGVGESVFGGKAGSHLTKATVVMTTLFFILTLILAALIGRGHWKSGGSGANVSRSLSEAAPAARPAPVAPAQKAAPAAKPATAAPAKKAAPAAKPAPAAPAKKAAPAAQPAPAKK